MLRFVDLTSAYWVDPQDSSQAMFKGLPMCAFIETADDRFIETDAGCHTFTELADFEGFTPSVREQLLALVPGREAFFATGGFSELSKNSGAP